MVWRHRQPPAAKTMRSFLTLALLLLILPSGEACRLSAEEYRHVRSPEGFISTAIGVTRQGTPIEAALAPDDPDTGTSKVCILLVGGLGGTGGSEQLVRSALAQFHKLPRDDTRRRRYALSAVLNANPDGHAKGLLPGNGAGGNPSRGYPPEGNYYDSRTDPESRYLWRWIGMRAPDLVVDVRAGARLDWCVPEEKLDPLPKLAARLKPAYELQQDDTLVGQLPKVAACETGVIPALQVRCPANDDFVTPLLAALQAAEYAGASPARRALQRRRKRSALEVAAALAKVYGRSLPKIEYIPAVAIVGRLRLAAWTDDANARRDVVALAAPFTSGQKPRTPSGGPVAAGHLVFCELARGATGEQRQSYLRLAREVADLAFDSRGRPRESMPGHNQMSDAVFMGGPVLAEVGALAGERKYLDACARHVQLMRLMCLRDDGLYRHSPLDEAAWGRGNGFPALGLAWVLEYFPQDHPQHEKLLQAFREHMAALARHQDPGGTWHQVIDRPESYRELTATCMITYAMARGVRLGWLDAEQYGPRVESGWRGTLERIGDEGRLVDVCTGTGKQKSLRDYYDRPAILGRDDRGGAMALLLAVEMIAWERARDKMNDPPRGRPANWAPEDPRCDSP